MTIILQIIFIERKNVYTRSYFGNIYKKLFQSHTLLFSRSSTVEILALNSAARLFRHFVDIQMVREMMYLIRRPFMYSVSKFFETGCRYLYILHSLRSYHTTGTGLHRESLPQSSRPSTQPLQPAYHTLYKCK